MIIESVTIILVLLLAGYMSVRRGRTAVLLAVLPLCLPSIADLSRYPGYLLLRRAFAVDYVRFSIAWYLLALVAAAVLVGGLSRGIAGRATRQGYAAASGIFLFLLTLIYLCNL